MSGAHSTLYPPSGAERWLECTASARLLANIEDTTTRYQAEGIAAHWLFEQHLIARLRNKPWSRSVRETYQHLQHTDHVVLDADMVEPLQECVNYIDHYKPRVYFSETKLSIPHTGSFGTADVIAISDVRAAPGDSDLHVFDLKYGRGVEVDAENNPQLMLYGLGALALVRSLLEIEPAYVWLHIMQPRTGNFCNHAIPVDRLVTWGEQVVRPRVKEIEEDRGVYRPSPAACRWCRIRADCDALQNTLVDVFASATEPAQKETDFATSDNEVLAAALHWVPVLTKWLDIVKDAARKRLAAGEVIPGYKLVAGRRTRTWPKDLSPVYLTMAAHEVAVDDLFPRAILSPNQLQTQKKEVYKLFEPLIEYTDGTPTVVPLEDKRPAWSPDELDVEDLGENDG